MGIENNSNKKLWKLVSTGASGTLALKIISLSLGFLINVILARLLGVKEFGAFVECLPGKEGLCHISELADFRVNKTEDICKLGDEIIVKCIGIDDKGRVKLSRRAAMEEEKTEDEAPKDNDSKEEQSEENAEPASS